MAKKKAQTRSNPLTSEDVPPSWIKAPVKREPVLKNATLDDYVWLGENGDIDTSSLKTELFGPEAALNQILGAIIDAYPREDRASREVRLADAVWALTGAPSSKRGPKERSSDDRLLSIIAREYFKDVYRLTPRKRKLATLIRLALRETGVDRELNRSDIAPEIRRLRDKFHLRKDKFLVEISEQSEVEAYKHSRLLATAMQTLNALGIKTKLP